MKMMIRLLVIDDARLEHQQAGQERVLEGLFDRYMVNMELLPMHRREQIGDHGDEVRGVADHIASMTEADIKWEYDRLTGHHEGPITDVVPY
jgi:dGTP triphosphohydrolase